MARPDAVYSVPTEIIKHFEGLVADPAGTLVDFRTKLASHEYAETVSVQNLGASGIKVHLDVGAGNDLEQHPEVANGGYTIQPGVPAFFNVKRRSVRVSGNGEAFEVTVARKL